MNKKAKRNWLIAVWASGVFVAVSAAAALVRATIRTAVEEAEADVRSKLASKSEISGDGLSREPAVTAP